ncbi:MAG: hypothetical protein HOQ27_14225 [Dermatophilaceae bacterium]|nr:hypothetical protein [Dermatophilaceae bacterium]
MKTWTGAYAVLLAAATLAACGGSKPAGCVTVSGDVAQAIVDGATGDLSVGKGAAIRADSGVYYAAFNITAAGERKVGVWALDEISPPGSIRAVDGFAQQFTRWPVLPGANGSEKANDAKACLG